MDSVVVAAGGVVWRDTPDGREVLLIHRERYDDWTMPKGKLDPGEHVLVAARREIQEETGLPVRLGPPLGIQRYDVRKNGGLVPKLVHYWAAQPVGESTFEPNDEVDGLEWLPAAEAHSRLSYPRDVAILAALETAVPVGSSIVLLRHSAAVKRKDWDGKDAARPLRAEGVAAADRLIGVLRALGVDRLISSDAERCVATVAPYAADAALPIEEHHEISEAGFSADPIAVRSLSGKAWEPGRVTAICSHRPVLPAIARELGLKVAKFSPGALLVAHRLTSGTLQTERFPAP